MNAKTILTSLALALTPVGVLAYDSGSTGADGAFNPTVNTELQLPPSGVFNFTNVNIPSGVTVRFRRNALNTPVVILASGDVNIAGTIDVSGTNGAATGAADDGNIGDDGLPGRGGPGGYDGGAGGAVGHGAGGSGLGPGGGMGGDPQNCSAQWVSSLAGSGGSFGSRGSDAYNQTSCYDGSKYVPMTPLVAGQTYGSSNLLPLIGGSGGGGGMGGLLYAGSGGGGGGGALLIAASGTVNITGAIRANGGNAGDRSGESSEGASGGGGSGGGIKIVATRITGNGTIEARGGSGTAGRAGGSGRIRLEAEQITRTASSSPAHTFGAPGPIFVAGSPTLRIASVAGVAAPAVPTGSADIILPATTPNPVRVVLQTTGVPPGNTVRLTVTPARGLPTSVVSPALAGSTASASASVDVSLPPGPSTLSATTTYTIVAALGDALAPYAAGERVEQVALSTTPGQADSVQLITVSGRVFEAPPQALALLAAHVQADLSGVQ